MTKYIVKNCPLYIKSGECFVVPEKGNPFDNYCKNNSDCPIKQVVGKCKEKLNKIYDPLAKAILQTLQVEEVK